MKNLKIIESTNLKDIIDAIPKSDAHFTNGTFAYLLAKKIVPTTLTAFSKVNKKHDLNTMVLAINSDKSMKALGRKTLSLNQIERKKLLNHLRNSFLKKKSL